MATKPAVNKPGADRQAAIEAAAREKAARKRAAEIQAPRPRLEKGRKAADGKKRGRLIVIEGSGGKALAAAARRLQKAVHRRSNPAGVSPWDASGIFYEVLDGPREVPGATPRTVLLLYAADLAFRLRWQILPALEDGATVIAAPYVETGVAFGRAMGIAETWLRELFSFAPSPGDSYRVAEDDIPALRRGKPADNFLEFAFLHLRRSAGRWPTEEIRNEFLTYLKGRSARGKCRLLTPEVLESLAAGE
jgi:hypothetical protein